MYNITSDSKKFTDLIILSYTRTRMLDVFWQVSVLKLDFFVRGLSGVVLRDHPHPPKIKDFTQQRAKSTLYGYLPIIVRTVAVWGDITHE